MGASLLWTSLLRHALPIIAVYVPVVQEHVSVAVAAGIAYLWSVVEKKATGTDTPNK